MNNASIMASRIKRLALGEIVPPGSEVGWPVSLGIGFGVGHGAHSRRISDRVHSAPFEFREDQRGEGDEGAGDQGFSHAL